MAREDSREDERPAHLSRFIDAEQAPGVAELPARLAVTYALLPSNEVDNSDHASVNRFVKALLLPALNGLRRCAPRILRPKAWVL
jgi:hypothetical protein